MKKYLHICPPWYIFYHGLNQPNVPLGAAYCARAALAAGWNVAIWNADLLPSGAENQFSEEMDGYEDYLNEIEHPHPVWAELRQVLQEIQPDVVGLTALTASYPSALRCAAIVKELLPDCKVIIGGPHPSALPSEVAKEQDIDYIVAGEGERALGELLTVLQQGQQPERIICRPTGGASFWPARGFVLDRYGLLSRDHFGLMMYTRGCPYACEFCDSHSVWGRKVFWREPEDLAAEMVAIHQGYDTRFFSFQDDTFTVNKKRTLALLDAIAHTDLMSVPGFRWVCNTRPERLDAELVDRMAETGCAAVAVGIEFGSERVLKKVKKGFKVDDARRAVKLIKEADMVASGQFMVGYPTETEAEMWQTVALADELECESVMLSVATPLPGTVLHNEAVELGLIDEIDWARVTTKNDGILMTVERDGKYYPMPVDRRQELVRALHQAFDDIQAKTLEAKNASRLRYEQEYLTDAEVVYGIN